MARLYDKVRLIDLNSELGHSHEPEQYLSGSVVIDITQAYRYGESHGFDIDDKCVAPPFNLTFLECIYLHRNLYAMGLSVGVLDDLDTIDYAPSSTKWGLFCLLFIQGNKKDAPIYSGSSSVVFLDDRGEIIESRLLPPHPDSYAEYKSYHSGEDDYLNLFADTISPFFFALALMNTKNVELIDHQPPPKLSKKHEKKYGEPLVSYKTIKVNPMRTVTRMDGDNVPSSERDTTSKGLLPLHIVAGNFADYRDGPGLFGKPELKGVFWRPQHVRGTAKRGVVVKDYEVQAPDDNDGDAQ